MNLNEEERKKYNTIQKVVNGKISKKNAECELGLSRKQINRLINISTTTGIEGFIHGNRGKTNKNKKDIQVINEIEKLYLTEYYDYNFEAFYEEIEDKYDISYSTMCKAFMNDDIISPIAHKNTIKVYNEKMQKAMS